MYRDAIRQLYAWKQKMDRKPLVIRGARQVGKTWLMKAFAASAYENTVYINFDNNPQMEALFSSDKRVERLITGIELYAGQKIRPEATLLIFDEIQEVPQALTALKYFNETAPEYQIVCAGSLLGVALHAGTSFPVGKVEFMDLHPMSFEEFLRAMGQDAFVDLLQKNDFDMMTAFQNDFIHFLRQYYFLGGMPEVVQNFARFQDFGEARNIQEQILAAYEQDFSKHAPPETVPRIRMLWNSIPSQLAKENKKFIYGNVREGARAKDYELALLWLADCGLIHRIHRATVPRLPLKTYEDPKAFKLYLADIGLLSCMVRLNQSVLLNGNDLFTEFKGALTEQYVLQHFKKLKNTETCYWTNDRGNAEVDFLLDTGTQVIPLEVKAEQNLKAKSLKTFCDKFHPQTALRTSMTNYKQENWLQNIPLWAISSFIQNLKS